MAQDVRSYLELLEKAGELRHITEKVDPDCDIAQQLFTEKEKALLFDNVKDYPNWKVIGQAPANWRQIGLAFGSEPQNIIPFFASRLDKGLIACKMVDTGPVKEVILKGDKASLLDLPAHQAAEKDPGRYIASGLCIIKDPETGKRNMAFHRLQVKGAHKTGIMMVAGKHTDVIFKKYEARNEAMPMAIVIGHHPMYYFAGGYTAPFGVDEMEVAGALLGEPVELARCETIDLEAPAYAEIVLEGEVLPGVREDEGPFCEFTGLYPDTAQQTPVFSLKAITMRHDAIFKAVQSGALTESIFYNSVPMAAAIFRDLRNVGGFAQIKNVSCNWGTTFNVVVQMVPRFYGEARHVLLAALSSVYLHQKIAVAVDDDIDIYDPQDVAWAIATRVNPEDDICIIPGVRGHPLDDSLPAVDKPGLKVWHRLGSRVLIDATKPPTSDPEARAKFDRALPPSRGKGGS